MSGTNPFRRKADQTASDAATAPVNCALPGRTEPRIPPIDTVGSCIPDVPRSSRTKVIKSVRIISPHSASSDDGHDLPQPFSPPARSVTSPPKPGDTYPENSEDESPNDPFCAGSDGTAGSLEDESTRQNTLSNSGNSQSGSLRTLGMPANPFEKTLASLSTEHKPSQSSPASKYQSQISEAPTTRPHYDVDEFKRLLLTGEKNVIGTNVPAPPSVSFQGYQGAGDSSSNTDTSSTSRQSIFEPVPVPLQESPRTSLDNSSLDDERQQLVGAQPSTLQSSKPSTPRHRHGKLVKPNAPQTVSFEDPSLSFSTSTITSKSPEPTGDSDRPLPFLPTSSNPGGDSTGTRESIKSEPHFGPAPVLQTGLIKQKYNPPAIPLSRRQSQPKPKPLSPSERPSRMEEAEPVEPFPSSQSHASTVSKAPPPPPPRRTVGLARVNSSSSTSTNTSIPLAQPRNSSDEVISNLAKSRPPVPPSRSPTISSVKRPQSQAIPGSPAVAPPPLPRRRGSSQSSHTPSSLSGDYRIAANERLRSDSGASSISHLQMTPMTPTPSSTESKDVMADLSALQREVDELRGKFRD